MSQCILRTIATWQRPLAAPLHVAALIALSLIFIAACRPIQPENAADSSATGILPAQTIAAPQEITATVLVNSLNLRAGPAREHTWLGNVRQREVMTVTGMTQECAWLWAIRSDGVRGWVAGAPNLVQTSVPCSEIPMVVDALLPTPPPTATRTATATALPTATMTRFATATTPPVTSTLVMTATEVIPETLAETATAALSPTGTVAETPAPTTTIVPTPSVTPTSPAPTSAPTETPTTTLPATETPPPGAVEIPEGMGCVQIGNYVGPELTISFTNLSTGEGYTDTVSPNEEKLFCMEPALYTVTADAPPPFDTADFEIEIVEGEGVHYPLIAR